MFSCRHPHNGPLPFNTINTLWNHRCPITEHRTAICPGLSENLPQIGLNYYRSKAPFNPWILLDLGLSLFPELQALSSD